MSVSFWFGFWLVWVVRVFFLSHYLQGRTFICVTLFFENAELVSITAACSNFLPWAQL